MNWARSLNCSLPRLTVVNSTSATSLASLASIPKLFKTVVTASTAVAVSVSPPTAALADTLNTDSASAGAIAAERMS